MSKGYTKTTETSWPVKGHEAADFIDHGWGLVSKEREAFGKTEQEANEHLQEKRDREKK